MAIALSLPVWVIAWSSPALASSSFGFQTFEASFTNANGTPDTQAGSHPYEATFSFVFNSALNGGGSLEPVGGEVKNLEVELPPGLIGDPTAVSQCTRQQLDEGSEGDCPVDTQIGVNHSLVGGGGSAEGTSVTGAVFNMVPPAGVPALFAEAVDHVYVFLEPHVRSGGDYGITVHVEKLPQVGIISNTTTFYGEPGGVPFLTMPTSCAAPLKFGVRANTWQNTSVTAEKSFELPAMTGCERLSFPPSISVAPDTGATDSPAGLMFGVTVPQEGLLLPEGLSTSDIQNATVTLPEGFVVNPGQAAGLQACKEGDVEGGDDLPLQHEQEDGEAEEEKFAGLPSCPNASKVGTVQIKTPLLEGSAEKELAGDVYVLQSNPPDLKLLIAASGDGVNVKLVANVQLNEETGQLRTTVTEIPGVPITSFKLAFSGGAQAALDTPTRCGEYTSTSDFMSWSSPFIPDAFPTSRLAITSGVDGAACPSGSLPFSPELTAGATTDQAGGFTSFSLLLQRGDAQQRIERLKFTFPAGFGGMLSKVPLCPEPQASKGECSAASQIGHATVASGPGPYPLTIPQPGDPESPMYLTGPYGGAPFGLTIVTHVIAGPFNLGTIVTRAKIEVDPHTAQITIVTDPLPQVVAGVPTDLRLVNAVADRPEFMFNPTNCDASSFAGTAYGTPPPGVGGPHAEAAISSHFQVGACRSLEFTPKFSVSTSGKTSKADGASLTVKVSYPNVPQGTDADIALTKVELPKQLPSRLTTLQKACTNAQFEANPAGCPTASMIGVATVHTPELPVALTGPAIFVSHGGEAFPSLTVVLQGDGVTIDLVGAVFVSKAGITSTTFKAVPDAPFSTFELTLPEGKYSALAADGNLCKETTTKTVKKKVTVKVKGRKKTETRKVKETVPATLGMPNEFVGQNGTVIKQTTDISVTGCADVKTVRKKAKKANRTHGRR